MSFTTYSTAVAGTVLAAAFWNQQVRDNGNILKTSIADDGRINGEVVRFYDNVPTIVAAASITIDLSTANWFLITLGANITGITISNWTASKGVPVVLEFKQDGTGGRTVAGWPAAVKGDGGTTTPTINSTVNHTTILTLTSRDGGTTIWWNYFIANGS